MNWDREFDDGYERGFDHGQYAAMSLAMLREARAARFNGGWWLAFAVGFVVWSLIFWRPDTWGPLLIWVVAGGLAAHRLISAHRRIGRLQADFGKWMADHPEVRIVDNNMNSRANRPGEEGGK